MSTTAAAEDRLRIELARAEMLLKRKLRAARVRRRLTVEQVARKIGVEAEQVERFESGKSNPTLPAINRYAEAVGVTITYLVEDVKP
ncbi:hypothetical protein E3G52_000327 [Mycobacteroides abscessus]|uniref:helix-turn-helix domain-containing protein n=1 Tax=Mycobacteroides abscessus TaxID=36809 RepID=UPI0018780579|nr:helix-turn-helix transcriptional regulator [Mycobacteroides abscessus]MBE5453463.1 hypothetical protein [Mycobacteroides abscessus]